MAKKEKTQVEEYLDNCFPTKIGKRQEDQLRLDLLAGSVSWIFEISEAKAKGEIRRYMDKTGLSDEWSHLNQDSI